MTTSTVDMFARRQDERLAVLPSKFSQYASEHPDADAVRWSGRAWSFAALATRARRYAALLSERVPEGGWVALCAGRSPETIALILGALSAGRAVLPLEPEHPVNRLRRTLTDARPALLVTDHTAARQLTIGYEADKALLDELAAEAILYEADGEFVPDSDDLAYVIYTSGSTGGPKGVMVQHRQLAHLVRAMADGEMSIAAGDCVLSVASFAFDMMVTDIFVSLANGATVALPPGGERQREPSCLLEAVESYAVDTVYATPSLLHMLVLAGLGDPGRRRVRVITGGEALSRSLAEELLRRCSRLYHGYGPTETTVYSSYHRVDDPGYLPLGRPVSGTSYYPLDASLNVVPLNVRAELAIGGSLVSAGYHDRPRLTAERFRPDPFADAAGARCYLSGDMVRVDNAGGAHFVGRADTQAKVRGHRIELGEVETAVLRRPGVRQCVAVIGEDASGHAELTAYVVGVEDTAALRESLLDDLPSAMVPTRFVTLDAIPLTVNGKPDREALGRTAAPVPTEAEEPPATDVERRIAQLWGEVLGTENVGADQGFFDLGGHSLLAMEIVAKIRGEFGVDLPVWELFAVPTVRAWAAALEEAMRAGPAGGGDGESAPTTFGQAALCVAEQVVPGVTSPGLVMSVALEGDLDVGELLAALLTVTERHPLLRTRFELRGVDSSQIVEPDAELDFDEVVCDGPAGRARAVREWAARPFDLATGPLFRTLLTELAEPIGPAVSIGRAEPTESIGPAGPTEVRGAARTLHLCFHDAICDAESARLVVVELAAAYGAHAAPSPDAGPASATVPAPAPASGPELAFGDLARAQRGQGTGAAAAELVAWWRSRLPADEPGRLREAGHRTSTRRLPMTAEQNARLRETAARHGVDVAAVVLDRLRAATGARVGALLLNGRGEGLDGLVGPLASTLLVPFTGTGPEALRADLDWAVEHAVPAEMLSLQLQGGARIRAVPEVAVASRPAPEPVTSADGRLVLRPYDERSHDDDRPPGGSTARTGIVLSAEITDRAEGECEVIVQYREDLVAESVLDDLFDFDG